MTEVYRLPSRVVFDPTDATNLMYIWRPEASSIQVLLGGNLIREYHEESQDQRHVMSRIGSMHEEVIG